MKKIFPICLSLIGTIAIADEVSEIRPWSLALKLGLAPSAELISRGSTAGTSIEAKSKTKSSFGLGVEGQYQLPSLPYLGFFAIYQIHAVSYEAPGLGRDTLDFFMVGPKAIYDWQDFKGWVGVGFGRWGLQFAQTRFTYPGISVSRPDTVTGWFFVPRIGLDYLGFNSWITTGIELNYYPIRTDYQATATASSGTQVVNLDDEISAWGIYGRIGVRF